MIETRLLQYFLAIAEEQSITKAAEYLHISQPTLSKQMIDLEASLGKQLLIRGRKRVTLTEEGTYLRGRAQEIISLMDKTESAFRENEQSITGDVYIGCGEHRSTFSAAMQTPSLSGWIKGFWIWDSYWNRKSAPAMIIRNSRCMKHGAFSCGKILPLPIKKKSPFQNSQVSH